MGLPLRLAAPLLVLWPETARAAETSAEACAAAKGAADTAVLISCVESFPVAAKGRASATWNVGVAFATNTDDVEALRWMEAGMVAAEAALGRVPLKFLQASAATAQRAAKRVAGRVGPSGKYLRRSIAL